ncbi:MAG: acetamidase/formamidase family protein [Anaerolineae bacterium]
MKHLEASANQFTPTSSQRGCRQPEPDPIHPLTGPVYVEGAEPGDALEVEIINLQHKGWGWNAVIPGFGLLVLTNLPPPLASLQTEGEVRYFSDADLALSNLTAA